MANKLADELKTELWEMSNKVAERKMSESTFRRKAKALLEAKTVNSPAQNRKVINDFLKVAKPYGNLVDSLDSLTRK